MANIVDQDKHFLGQLNASLPKDLIGMGQIARLLNGKFVKGAITNALGVDEIKWNYAQGNDKRIYASRVTYRQLLREGDIQFWAPLENLAGKFLVAVISGILFLLDTETFLAYDITPNDAFLPDSSAVGHLSYVDNDGGTYGVGGYLVIFNYPNRPIFVSHHGARVSNKFANEVPAARLGATAGNRLGVISGENILLMSDPVGGASSLAPLTFNQIYMPSTGFTGQTHTIGSALDVKRVTAVGRLPKFLGPNQDFLAQNMIISTKTSKYIIAAGAERSSWPNIQFITYAGSTDGIAGPHALTNIGDNLLYISSIGRIKSIAQDQQRETGMVENFMDDGLGQYLCHNESSFHYRDWYQYLDHSYSVLKFNRDHLYATVYPIKAPAIGRYGQKQFTRTHRALAVASLSPNTQLGSQASPTWEGFYDWINPVSMCVLANRLYVIAKDPTGRIRYYKMNHSLTDDHVTTVYSRGYFSSTPSPSKSIARGSLYFRRLSGKPMVTVSYLANEKWIEGYKAEVLSKLFKFTVRTNNCRTNAQSIPLKIDISHAGCRFELESVHTKGEAHAQE